MNRAIESRNGIRRNPTSPFYLWAIPNPMGMREWCSPKKPALGYANRGALEFAFGYKADGRWQINIESASNFGGRAILLAFGYGIHLLSACGPEPSIRPPNLVHRDDILRKLISGASNRSRKPERIGRIGPRMIVSFVPADRLVLGTSGPLPVE